MSSKVHLTCWWSDIRAEKAALWDVFWSLLWAAGAKGPASVTSPPPLESCFLKALSSLFFFSSHWWTLAMLGRLLRLVWSKSCWPPSLTGLEYNIVKFWILPGTNQTWPACRRWSSWQLGTWEGEKGFKHRLMNTGRWRNDVGRRLADLEIVLGTHRREVQVKRSQSNPWWPLPSRWKDWLWSRRQSWWSKTGERTLPPWQRGWEGWRSSPGRSNLVNLDIFLCICRVGAARTCHHLLKAGLRWSGKPNGHSLMIRYVCQCHNKIQGVWPLLHRPWRPWGGCPSSPGSSSVLTWGRLLKGSALMLSRCTVTCVQAQQGWGTTCRESRRWTTAGEPLSSRETTSIETHL